MPRINERMSMGPAEMITPLLDYNDPEGLDMPKVRFWRFVARSFMMAAEKRKERMIAIYEERKKRQELARARKEKERYKNLQSYGSMF